MDKKELSLVGKIASVISGPVTGLLPPRWQMKLTKRNYDAACYMSTTSRIFNGLWSLYTATSLVSKIFGVDIDPSAMNLATNIGIGVFIDTALREIKYAFSYGLNSPEFMNYHEPWGEPILSSIDFKLNSDWYYKNQI